MVEARDQAAAASERRVQLEAELGAARTGLEAALDAERAATIEHEAARQLASIAVAARVAAAERLAGSGATLATARARLTALQSRLAEDDARGIARAARRLGGHRLDEDLVIAPELRAAAESALAEATRAYIVDANAVTALASERGSLVVAERAASSAATEDARERRFRERLSAAGGGVLDLGRPAGLAWRRSKAPGPLRVASRSRRLPGRSSPRCRRAGWRFLETEARS